MVNIIPFKGVRPVPEKASIVASVPYDVISSEKAKEVVEKNPLSFLRVVKPEVDLSPDTDLYDEKVYQKGKENLKHLVTTGVLIKDNIPSFYIYRQKMGDHIQTGLVAAASVQDYIDDNIKKHEHTREDKELDRTRHIDSLNANTGPVFLTYKHNDSIDKLVAEICQDNPICTFTAEDGIEHTFWRVNDSETTENICTIFASIKTLYVADGHHRSAAAVRVSQQRAEQNPLHFGKEPYNYFLTVIFPDNQMQILAYNRVIKDLNNLKVEDFTKKVEQHFIISETDNPVPQQKHNFSMYIDNKWYNLKAKDDIIQDDDPVKSLDVYILQEYLLSRILGIENPRKDKRIDFVGGIHGAKALEEAVQQNQGGVAFFLYPVDIKSLINISEAGEVMPPKSTWFEPKLRSGLIIHSIV